MLVHERLLSFSWAPRALLVAGRDQRMFVCWEERFVGIPVVVLGFEAQFAFFFFHYSSFHISSIVFLKMCLSHLFHFFLLIKSLHYPLYARIRAQACFE